MAFRCSRVYRPGDPLAIDGYVLEHRLIAREKFGTSYDPAAHQVHHIDGNPKNNRPDNLIPLTPKDHRRIHAGWKEIGGQWWKPCYLCHRFLEVESNFYRRNSGHQEFISECKTCCASRAKRLRERTANSLSQTVSEQPATL